jgi:hypothetical protein
MSTPYLTLGDTLLINGVYRDANGTPVNLTTAGITVEAWLREPASEDKIPMTVSLANQTTSPGSFTAEYQTTEDMMKGAYALTLSYLSGAVRQSTRPVKIEFGL